MTVQADVAPGMQAATVVQALAPKIEALNASLPSGYHIEVGGTVEESSKAQTSVAAVSTADADSDVTVLMIQLQSFNRLFLVLSVAPSASSASSRPCSSPTSPWASWRSSACSRSPA